MLYGTDIFTLLLGYPLRPWILTPFRNPAPNSPEQRYNDKFTTIRSGIERCNGILKNRFRCLLKHRVLHYTPAVSAKIILSCVILHNMCITHNIPEPEIDPNILEEEYGLDIPVNDINENFGRVNPDLAAARQLQQRIVHAHFR